MAFLGLTQWDLEIFIRFSALATYSEVQNCLKLSFSSLRMTQYFSLNPTVFFYFTSLYLNLKIWWVREKLE